MAKIQVRCTYCPSVVLLEATDDGVPDEVAWRKYWKQIMAPAHSFLVCPACGSETDFVDDGVAAAVGAGGVKSVNVTRPKLDSLDTGSGEEAGGTEVTLYGDFFNVGTLVVKFGGITAPDYSSKSKTHVVVTTPPGTGLVDVTVENEHGRRPGDGTLLDAFQYT